MGLDVVVPGGVGDSSDLRASDSSSKGRGFESRQEGRENFLLKDHIFLCRLLFRYPFHPNFTSLARK